MQFLTQEEVDKLDPNVFNNIPLEIALQQVSNDIEKLASKRGYSPKSETVKKRISDSLKKNTNKKRKNSLFFSRWWTTPCV